MKQLYFWGCLVITVLVGSLTGQAAPHIEFDRSTYDFGQTSMVRSVSGTFTFQNTGDALLEIDKPTTSCGCTVAGVKPDKLAPGESGELTFTLNVGSGGSMTKLINVPSNDPDNPTTRLNVKVRVVKLFEVTPNAIQLPVLEQGSHTNISVAVKRLSGEPLNLLRAETDPEMITVQLENGDESDPASGFVHLEIEGAGRPRHFAHPVKIFTDDSGSTPAVMIPVTGRIFEDVVIEPERLIWGIGNVDRLPPVHRDRALTRTLRIVTAQQQDDFQLKQITSDLQNLDLESAPLEDGNGYLLTAKFHEAPSASIAGSITIETNLEKHPKLTVPVTVSLLPR